MENRQKYKTYNSSHLRILGYRDLTKKYLDDGYGTWLTTEKQGKNQLEINKKIKIFNKNSTSFLFYPC